MVQVDAIEIVRTARRRAGLSQRPMAAASGVGHSTLAGIEAGRRAPSLAVLRSVLAVAGLELAVDQPVEPVCGHVRQHLQDSLTVRLYRWLGGAGDPRRARTLPLWSQLCAVAAAGRTELSGRAALGLWLPAVDRPTVLEVGFRLHPGAPSPVTPGLQLVGLSRGRGTPVTVSIGGHSITVPTPGELALHVRCGPERAALRGVARLLHDEGPWDGAGRRTAGHRDPDHEREEGEVWHTKRWKQLEMPPAHDRRSWRLDDEASLSAWLRAHGFPA